MMNIAILSTLISFFVVILTCPLLIPALEKLKFGQAVRELGPKTHYKKAGTPTMGGIVIVFGIIVASIFFVKKGDSSLLFAILVTAIFGLIGFLDDYIKIIQKNVMNADKGLSIASLGMSARFKLILQLAVALALAIYTAYHPELGTDIMIPFTSIYLDLGIFFIPFVVFAVVAVVNAVNLTDGLDGLACGVTLIVFIFFLFSAISNGFMSMGIFGSAVIGSCLGFLCYNFNPAKVFMGDTGSMALGGAVVVISILTKTELYILIAGLIYVIETLSVAMQVGYYKISHGKRIFKMAPIHHHFELCGWEETRIVIVFWVFTAICVLISLLSLNITF